MANVNSFSQTIDASGQLRLPSGNFVYLISSTSALTISLQKGGSTEIFQGAIGGLQLGRVSGWDWAWFQAAAGTVVTGFYGITSLREDVTILQQQIATVAGTVNVQQAPTVAVTDTPAIVTVAGQHAVFPQNLLRRSVTVFSDPGNVGVHYIRKGGGANNVGFVAPGTSLTFAGTYAIDYSTAVAGDTLYVFEES